MRLDEGTYIFDNFHDVHLIHYTKYKFLRISIELVSKLIVVNRLHC